MDWVEQYTSETNWPARIGPTLRTTVTFYALPTGEKYLHFGVRATPKA